MEELVNKIRKDAETFLVDAQNQAENGVKSAGARARKLSLELEKALKEFRKKSIEASKK